MTLRRETSGAVYVEFLAAAIPIFTTFLTIVQFALMYTANLTVGHAANRAARAAYVICRDGEQDLMTSDTGPSPQPMYQPGDPGSGFDWIYRMMQAVDSVNYGSNGILNGAETDGRHRDIRAAAIAVMIAVSPKYQVIRDQGGESLKNAFDKEANLNIDALGEKANYAAHATFTTVTAGCENLPDNGTVDVRVEYLFRCSVPLVDAVICGDGNNTFSPGAKQTGDSSKLAGELGGRYRTLRADASVRLPPKVFVPGELYDDL